MNTTTDNLQMLFSKMEEFVSTKTVVGEAVHFGNVVIVPLIDVTLGMGTGVGGGGGDSKSGGGGGAVGAKMIPSAVIVIVDGTVQLVNVKNQDSVNKLVDMVPGILSKLNLGGVFGKKDKQDETAEIGEG